MLVLLALVVVGVSLVLWWMRDRYSRWPERFVGEQSPPTADEMLGAAFSVLPSELQTEAKATELVTPETIEANYLAVVEQQQAALDREQAVFDQTIGSVFINDPQLSPAEQIARINNDPRRIDTGNLLVDPRESAEQTISRVTAAGTAAAVAAAEAAQTSRRGEFQQLLQTVDASAKDACFQRQCTSIQAGIDRSCMEFRNRCFYGHNYDVTQCLVLADKDCSQKRVDECRTACTKTVELMSRKSILKQGDVLTTNQRLQSLSGNTVLILRDTGNLELYENSELIWSSRTTTDNGTSSAAQNPYKLMIYPNGDMVIKNALNIEVWHTNTWMNAFQAGSENGPYQCVVSEKMMVLLNRNGNILWSSKSS